jgi:hypothetical protein
MTTSFRRSFQFFAKHAGYIVGERAKGALALARAERWATDSDLEFLWSDNADGNLGDHAYWCAHARASRPCQHEITACALIRPCPDDGVHCGHAETLASLSGIIDADHAYQRVVQAELALEAMEGN